MGSASYPGVRNRLAPHCFILGSVFTSRLPLTIKDKHEAPVSQYGRWPLEPRLFTCQRSPSAQGRVHFKFYHIYYRYVILTLGILPKSPMLRGPSPGGFFFAGPKFKRNPTTAGIITRMTLWEWNSHWIKAAKLLRMPCLAINIGMPHFFAFL